MRWGMLFCWLLFTCGSLISKPSVWSIEPGGKLTLAVPREPTSDEMPVVEFKVGRRDIRIVVRSPDKTILGVIAPYGKLPKEQASYFSVPVPKKLLSQKKVSLLLEVSKKGGKTTRPPLPREIEYVKLEFLKTSERTNSK
jgi:hypothetical protein